MSLSRKQSKQLGTCTRRPYKASLCCSETLACHPLTWDTVLASISPPMRSGPSFPRSVPVSPVARLA